MPVLRRTRIATALAILGCAAACTGSASATSPNPYSTAAGTGAMSLVSTSGTGSCSLTGIAAGITNNSGSITGFQASCVSTQFINRLTYSLPLTVTVNLSTTNPVVTVAIASLRTSNMVLGSCLYGGTLSGAGTDTTGFLSVSGSVTLNSGRSSGFCDGSMGVAFSGNLPGLLF